MEQGGSPITKIFSNWENIPVKENSSAKAINHSISSEVWVNVEEHVDKDNRIG